jgi:hypothetical protein
MADAQVKRTAQKAARLLRASMGLRFSPSQEESLARLLSWAVVPPDSATDPAPSEAQAAHAAGPDTLTGPILILAPPRSCTSVVGAMLGRHPQTYGLPEVHLFGCDTLAEWWQWTDRPSHGSKAGLLRAVAELYFGGQTGATVRRASGWLRRRLHLTTGAMLEELAERVYPRILVEKSPNTVWHMESLRRAHAMFPGARFIHLLRHPRAHGESVLKYMEWAEKTWPERIGERAAGDFPTTHWTRRLCLFPPAPAADGEEPQPAPPEGALDPQWSWYTLNRNIAEFLDGVPAAQVCRVRAEELLADPEPMLCTLAAWLGLRNDPEAIEEMMHPERSPFACPGPAGARGGNDAFFMRNPALRPARAKPMSLDGPLSWREDGQGFAPVVRQLAQELGYT